MSNAVPVSHPESIDCWAGFCSATRRRTSATCRPRPPPAARRRPTPARLVSAVLAVRVCIDRRHEVQRRQRRCRPRGRCRWRWWRISRRRERGGNAVGTVAGVAGAPYGGPGATNPDAGSSLNPPPGGGSSGDTANGFNHTDGGKQRVRARRSLRAVEPTGVIQPAERSCLPHLAYVDTSDPSNTVEVRDNQSYVAGSWVADPKRRRRPGARLRPVR